MWFQRSIRDQVLVPLVAVQVVTVATTALVAAWLAAARAEAELVRQLDGVVATLGRTNFPITSGVLGQMRGLSGAHFVACSGDGRVLDSTLPALEPARPLPPSLRSLAPGQRLDLEAPRWDLEGERYLAASVRSPGSSNRPSLLVLYPEAAWRRARWETATAPLVVGLLALAPMAGITGWVAHRLGARLRSVQGRVAAIAAGDFGELDDGNRSDEVHSLICSINQMSRQLREMRQAIRRTERAGVLAQLAAGLAHQLRNAATGARMAVQLHARRCPGAATASGPDASLDVALGQLTLCEEQVKRLLTMGRGEARVDQQGDAVELIAEVARLVGPTCRHAGVSIDLDVPGSMSIRADLEGLRAALLNLAHNAIEASGPEGSVHIELSSHEGLISFAVTDDGPGPPESLASTLFEPFVTGKPEGVGLGLALARRVAVEHGGDLTWGRREGRTRFVLTIPHTQHEHVEISG